MRAIRCTAFGLALAAGALAAQQSYIANNITGQLTRTAIVNLLQLAQAQQAQVQTINGPGADIPNLTPAAGTRGAR